jgi:hypothetical protein
MVPSLASEKIPSDNTGDRSRDLPTSSATFPKKEEEAAAAGVESITVLRAIYKTLELGEGIL